MEDLLQCPICCINYDLKDLMPRQLPCQHIICTKCLPFMVKRKQGEIPFIECPICKTEHHKSIDEIPRSLITVQLLDAMSAKRPSANASNSPPRSTPPAQGSPTSAYAQQRWPGASSILTPTPTGPATAPQPPLSPTYLNRPIPLSTMPTNPENSNTNPFLNVDDPFDIDYLNRAKANGSSNNQNQAPIDPRPAPYPQQAQSNGYNNNNNPFYRSPSLNMPMDYEAPPPSYSTSMNQNGHNRQPGPAPSSTSYSSNHHQSIPASSSYGSSNSTNNHSNNSNSQPPVWDTRAFLKKIFNEMDINRDGSITSVELQAALKRGQSTSEFNIKTIDILIDKYDKNGDREISFDEFYDLFTQLNDEYENFLIMDADGSGSIDIHEFSEALRKRGYNFTDKFFRWLFDEIRKKTGHQGIMFDNYIRVAARFDYLCRFYRITPYYQKISLEAYLKKTFFQNFW